MSKIKTYTANDIELHTLELFARFVNVALSELGDERYSMRVKDMYFDFGQHWMYTGLITDDAQGLFGGWQSVCPRDYELILDTDSIEKLSQMAVYYATELMSGKISIHLYERFE